MVGGVVKVIVILHEYLFLRMGVLGMVERGHATDRLTRVTVKDPLELFLTLPQEKSSMQTTKKGNGVPGRLFSIVFNTTN